MSETQSPLSRLVLFIVCLAIAGTFVAGMHYFAVDLPQQKATLAPVNGLCPASITTSVRSCGNYGDRCYACLVAAETGFGCEISGADKTDICN
ncbi:MAG: hypothetical protein LUQ71_06295 [Methanoregula sp.]|jgi:hypothetical protein|nr:hypothetical protein [Methanoregula sp.]